MADPAAARARLQELASALRGFVVAAGAQRAVLLLDQGDDRHPLLVDCAAEGPVELTEGEAEAELEDVDAAPPATLPHVHALPPFEVDPGQGEVTAVPGGVEHYAQAVRALAQRFPGRSVLTVAWDTTDPGTPLSLAARGDEPMVLALGETQFALDA